MLASGNPAARATEAVLHFALPRAARARLDVYDVAGRLVATVFDGALPAGPGELRWNGHDAAGRSLGAGIYFYRLSADGERLTVRGIKL
jgi:flagellar hook assembly protein FlgD